MWENLIDSPFGDKIEHNSEQALNLIFSIFHQRIDKSVLYNKWKQVNTFMSVDIALPDFVECKTILPNACWVEAQNDQKDTILLVSVPCEEFSSIIIIDINGKRNEMCFKIGSIVKIENNKLHYNKNRLEDCDSEE